MLSSDILINDTFALSKNAWQPLAKVPKAAEVQQVDARAYQAGKQLQVDIGHLPWFAAAAVYQTMHNYTRLLIEWMKNAAIKAHMWIGAHHRWISLRSFVQNTVVVQLVLELLLLWCSLQRNHYYYVAQLVQNEDSSAEAFDVNQNCLHI